MDKKIQKLNSAIEKAPDDINLYFERAQCFFDMKKYKEYMIILRHAFANVIWMRRCTVIESEP